MEYDERGERKVWNLTKINNVHKLPDETVTLILENFQIDDIDKRKSYYILKLGCHF
jgi:hypothetical protein